MNSNEPARSHDRLAEQHLPDAIARRLRRGATPAYIGDVVLGSIDGCVTTFAIASAAFGAGLSAPIVLIMGLANLVADGFSMAVSNFQNAQTEHERLRQLTAEEHEHIRRVPDGEREELRQIYARKGLTGETLEQVVAAISSDRDIWVDTMLREEHRLSDAPRAPGRAAAITFLAFVCFGALPLMPFVFADAVSLRVYLLSAAIAALVFFSIGCLKARVAATHVLGGGLRVLAAGLTASALALIVGVTLSHV